MRAKPPRSNEEQYLEQELQEFFCNPSVLEDIKRVRAQLKQSQGGKGKLESNIIMWESAKQVAKKYHKHLGWVRCIVEFIVDGKPKDNPHAPILDFGDGHNLDPETGEKIYSLIIFPRTSPDDAVRAIVANKAEELRNKRRTPKRKSERDALVRKLSDEGKSKAAISNAIEKFGGDSFSNIYRILATTKPKKKQ